jgi:hypothetical protein
VGGSVWRPGVVAPSRYCLPIYRWESRVTFSPFDSTMLPSAVALAAPLRVPARLRHHAGVSHLHSRSSECWSGAAAGDDDLWRTTPTAR